MDTKDIAKSRLQADKGNQMTISQQRLERSRRLKRERVRLDDKTENNKWYIHIHLHHKDGVLSRKGYIEKQNVGRLYKQYATWDYGERDDTIKFSRKVPEYVKEMCVELGLRMKRQTPFTGIDFRDPDYDLEQYK